MKRESKYTSLCIPLIYLKQKIIIHDQYMIILLWVKIFLYTIDVVLYCLVIYRYVSKITSLVF